MSNNLYATELKAKRIVKRLESLPLIKIKGAIQFYKRYDNTRIIYNRLKVAYITKVKNEYRELLKCQ